MVFILLPLSFREEVAVIPRIEAIHEPTRGNALRLPSIHSFDHRSLALKRWLSAACGKSFQVRKTPTFSHTQ